MQKDATDHPRIRGEHGWPRHHIQPHPGSSPHTRGARSHTAAGQVNGRIIPAYAGSTPTRRPAATSSRDHPRIRGEHDDDVDGAVVAFGSSPHTRGARRRRHGQAQAIRIIPAYAGSTGSKPTRPHRMRDHPRIRGEHLPAQQTGRVGLGSSPHTRGARPCGRAAREAGRIIPAYAGSTRRASRRSRPRPDHPRIRGEHQVAALHIRLAQGSSPHTRGARTPPAPNSAPSWIIPAYAGSTSHALASCRRSWDHPRIRGEHVRLRRAGAVGEGIIPAYAGSTPDSWIVHAEHWDHPRIRGEHLRPSPDAREAAGSSPHTRGARAECVPVADFPGIIPAYAGSTTGSPPSPPWTADHPRIRGEHTQWGSSAVGVSGSSPHTRGALTRRGSVAEYLGIIPAYAGSTTRPGRVRPPGRDHPRIRGEHSLLPGFFAEGFGSSPHTRGARSDRSRRRRELPDHPRIRGEHTATPPDGVIVLGSSPHTRGAPSRKPPPVVGGRIIPAYAGSTGTTWSAMKPTTDHPRIRGEHPRGRRAPARVSGSSPHTRGAHGDAAARRHRLGIIPAYAGSTRPTMCWLSAMPDHPRIRGEHLESSRNGPSRVGSSPHTRGARTCRKRPTSSKGIIPAYAGSTPPASPTS